MSTPAALPRLLNAGRLPPALMARLAERFAVSDLPPRAEQADFLARHGAGFVAATTSAAVGLDAALLPSLPRLQVISSFGVGLDKVPVAEARARGIAVGYTPDVLNDCVADLAFALLLDVMRRTPEADRYVRQGRWLQAPFALGRRVSGARLGLVGYGRIGQTIARRASGFDMAVRYHSRRPVAGHEAAHEPRLTALAAWCDALVVITAGGPETRHLVNAEVLAELGPEGCLVNVARGSVIDEAALVAALAERRIAGAGLDVFEDEPRVPEALFAMDHVVLAPHIASATVQTRQAMADRVFDNLASFFDTGRLVSAAEG